MTRRSQCDRIRRRTCPGSPYVMWKRRFGSEWSDRHDQRRRFLNFQLGSRRGHIPGLLMPSDVLKQFMKQRRIARVLVRSTSTLTRGPVDFEMSIFSNCDDVCSNTNTTRRTGYTTERLHGISDGKTINCLAAAVDAA